MSKESHDAFMAACDSLGIPASQVMLDLVKEAVVYMTTVCQPRNKWFPPLLVPDTMLQANARPMLAAEGKVNYGTRAPGVAAKGQTDGRL